jgi:two-component system, sensor histidine kinase ChiS
MVKKRILLVEDDLETARMLARVLSIRYEVNIATDGLQGLTLAAATPAPDLIITDVMMPGLDGLHMVERIKALDGCARLPIIFLTACSTPEDVIAGIRAGARSYLMKPIKIEELYERVQRTLSREMD